jgi:hypothetical protein
MTFGSPAPAESVPAPGEAAEPFLLATLERLIQGTEPGDAGQRARSLRHCVLLAAATSLVLEVVPFLWASRSPLWTVLPIVTVSAAAGWAFGMATGWAKMVTVVGWAAACGLVFPDTANHQYLIGLLLALAAVTADGDAGDDRLFIAASRLMLVIVVLAAGAQKLAWGGYRSGEFLAALSVQDRRFRWLLEVVPAAEKQRLLQLAGQWRIAPDGVHLSFAWWPAVTAARLVVATELVLPCFLFPRLTRVAAAAGIVALFALIMAVFREATFAFLGVCLAALFLPLSA